MRTEHVTPLALDIFRKMESLPECTCSKVDATGHRPGGQCRSCKTWWKMNGHLHTLLGLSPHEWPAYEDPESGNPYYPGTPKHNEWQPDLSARARYRMLAKAADAS